MTVLENNVISPRNKLSLKRDLTDRRHQQLKRKCLFEAPPPPAKRLLSAEMLNGYGQAKSSAADTLPADAPVATLSNMGNTCFLNSVLYTLRFAPTFLHNLHHVIGDLALVANRLMQNKARTSSLGRTVVGGALAGARSTSSKDLLTLGGGTEAVPKSKVQVVTEKLHELYVTMHNLELKESNEPYQPVALLQAIREANYIFEGNHQQDAHELLVYLLDNIRETCEVLTQQVQCNPALLLQETVETDAQQVNSSKLWSVRRSWTKKSQKKKEKSHQISEEQQNGTSATDTEDASSIESNNDLNNPKKRLAYNFVAEDFEGITLRRTKCLECESVTERKEPFYDIPVPISLKEDDYESNCSVNPSEIYRKACVTSEKLCDSNKYLCDKCKRYNEASRDVLFEKLPNIMVLQLKRFTTTTTAGVQKVNTYLPTPLELECFCETCCKLNASGNESPHPPPPHRYRLCCVIMHLGGTMASGHYIAYVKASSDHSSDYAECPRDYLPKGSLSASSSEKSLNIFKLLKPKQLANTLLDNRNILSSSKSGVLNGVRVCKSVDCCGVKLNKNVVENVINSFTKKGDASEGDGVGEDMWLECDDENVRAISSQEFEEELSYKPNSTSTPYLLFYSKITDSSWN